MTDEAYWVDDTGDLLIDMLDLAFAMANGGEVSPEPCLQVQAGGRLAIWEWQGSAALPA